MPEPDCVITLTLVDYLYQRQLEIIKDDPDPIQFKATCYGLVADELGQIIGTILTTRAQGVDCMYCENSEDHVHVVHTEA